MDGDGHEDEGDQFDHEADAGEGGAEIGFIFEQQVETEQEEEQGVALKPAGERVDRYKKESVNPGGAQGVVEGRVNFLSHQVE